MQIIELFEARRNNNQFNKAGAYIDIISQYFGTKGAYISFQKVPKLGVNPNPMDKTTPAGFYAYPLESEHVIKNILSKELEYGSDFPYVFLIIADTKNEISNNSSVEEPFRKLEEYVKKHSPEYYDTFASYKRDSIDHLYHMIRRLSGRHNKPDQPDWRSPNNQPGMMNKLLRVCGIDILTDLGEGFIGVEMAQSVFVSAKPIYSVEKFYNSFPTTKGELIRILKNGVPSDTADDLPMLLLAMTKRKNQARRLFGFGKDWLDMDIKLSPADCYNIISGEGWSHIRDEMKEQIDRLFNIS